MRGDSDFPHTKCLWVLPFQQKVDHFQILATLIKINYLKLLLSFVTVLKILPYIYSMLRTYSMKRGFISVSLLPFTKKKLGRSSYDIPMTNYDAMLIFSLFRFVADAQDF